MAGKLALAIGRELSWGYRLGLFFSSYRPLLKLPHSIVAGFQERASPENLEEVHLASLL